MHARRLLAQNFSVRLWTTWESFVREVISPSACVGCLDTGQCWVCLGEGTTAIERRAQGFPDDHVPCPSCNGSGDCAYCAAELSA